VVELRTGYTLRLTTASGLDEKPETTMTAVCGRRRGIYGAHQFEVLLPGSLVTLVEINASGQTLAAIPDRRPWSRDGCLQAHR
jgi:hypothetical protein